MKIDFRIDDLFSSVQSSANSENVGDLREDIAIIGIASRFPNADNTNDFWKVVSQGLDCVGTIPDGRKADVEQYYRHTGQSMEKLIFEEGAYLDRIDDFDYSFFKISPNEANLMDPNQRLFLQTAWEVLEDAGYGGDQLKGSMTGVFVGFGNDNEYKRLIDQLFPSLAAMAAPGNIQPFIGSRISYMLDFKGPSMLVNTTCSSSLVAVHLACQSIRKGECDQAIAGGVKIHVLPVRKERIGVEASDGRTRSFDEGADGTGLGEGTAAVMLKPLSMALADHDQIYAVIKGSAINQTGTSIGLTAPNSEAQKEVILQAWEDAGLDPATLSMWEAHGSGTRLGDPIEIEGIRKAFETRRIGKKQFCAIGSVKTNIGHLDNVAGIAGLIKAILSIKNGKIPPSLHFEYPNSEITFPDTPVYVNTELSDWPEQVYPKRCGVSSFGISGTNCHIVLEEAPLAESPGQYDNESGEQLRVLTVSAETEAGLKKLLKSWQTYVLDNEIDELCYTANTSRSHYQCRVAIIATNSQELHDKLEQLVYELCHDPNRGIFVGLPIDKETEQHVEQDWDIDVLKTTMFRPLTTDKSALTSIRNLCESYRRGAEVPWQLIYEDKEIRKTSIPTYPFQTSRCWLPYTDIEAESPSLLSAHWIVEELSLVASLERRRDERDDKEGFIVVFNDNSGIGDRLIKAYRSAKIGVLEVCLGDRYSRIGEDCFTVGIDYSSFRELYEHLRYFKITRIIHIASVSLNDKPSKQGYSNSKLHLDLLNKGLISFYYFIQQFMNYKFTQETEIILISNHVYEVTRREPYLNPVNAALYGLGRTVRLEGPFLCRAIDIDDVTTTEQLLNEIASPFKNYSVAYREGTRYVEKWRLHEEESLPIARESFAEHDDVFVVAGGAGGIGLEIMLELSQTTRLRFAVIGTTRFPEKEHWRDILVEHHNEQLRKKVDILGRIEKNGSTITFYEADIADDAGLQCVLDQIRSSEGPIRGVIHSAGKPGQGALVNKTPEALWRVIDPKIKGTLNLHALTKDDPLRAFILFSSVTSLSGEPGQGDYAAANHFQDVFAAYRRRTHPHQKTITIGWSAWENTGMARLHDNSREEGIFKALSVNVARSLFTQILSLSCQYVAVGLVQQGGHIYGRSAESLGIGLSEPLRAKLHRANGTEGATSSIIHGASNKQWEAVASTIGEVWSQVLGYREFHINDNFYEIGGNSILLTQVYERLVTHYPGMISVTDLFAHPTIERLAVYIGEQAVGKISGPTGPRLQAAPKGQDIAIIGLATRMPYADNTSDFWNNLVSDLDCIQRYPEARVRDSEPYLFFLRQTGKDVSYAEGGYMERIDDFDYRFFNLSYKEASMMDPNQRLFLQTAWQSLEDAGYGGNRLRGSKTGVFVGHIGMPVYGQMITMLDPESAPLALSGNVTSVIASRISYLLDFKGPNLVVDTACSSSLVAVHLACQSIRNGECDQAIAGSVKIIPSPIAGLSGIGIDSKSNRTRTFDNSSDGTAWGEGVVSFLLKPLDRAVEDGDHIYAVIKGGAVNQDGRSTGITSPNPIAQEELLHEAWVNAGIEPETITYIEAHGTGTRLGDPIEISAIRKAFSHYTDKQQFCAIGSVKTNIGHLDHCSGAAGLLKTVLSLKNRIIPSSLHFESPNRNIDFADSAVYFADKMITWNADVLRCGVSSFGLSGTNCHLVLEEPPNDEQQTDKSEGDVEVFTVSASSKQALMAIIEELITYLPSQRSSNLRSICYTMNTGRGHHQYRIATLVRDKASLLRQLRVFAIRGLVQPEVEDMFYGTGVKEGSQGLLSLLGTEQLPMGPFEICKAYIAGKEINWELWYGNRVPRKTNLPVYCFDKDRCWFETNGLAVNFMAPVGDSTVSDVRDKGVTLRGELEHREIAIRLSKVWQGILGIQDVGPEDDFFESGGDSITAMMLSTRISKEFGCDIPVSKLFEASSFGEQVTVVAAEECRGAVLPVVSSPPSKHNYYPLTSAQRSIYIQHALSNNKLLYNETHAYRVKGKFDSKRLEQVIQQLINRHDSLRTSYVNREGELMQFVYEGLPFRLKVENVEDEDVDNAIRTFSQPFALDKPPLLRMKLLDLKGSEQVLLLDTHHILMDGSSMEILSREIKQLYEGAELPPLPIQMQDYAVWHNDYVQGEKCLKQERYWLSEFAKYPSALRLPAVPTQSQDTCSTNAIVRFALANDVVDKLQERTHATPFVLALSALKAVLGRTCGMEDVTVGIPVLGRPIEEAQSLIGMFVNMLAIRSQPLKHLTFDEYVSQVKRKVAAGLDNQDYPLDLLMDKLRNQGPDRHPLFNVVLIFEHYNEEKGRFEDGEIKLSPMQSNLRKARYDLVLHVVVTKSGWECSFLYAPATLESNTAFNFAENIVRVMEVAADRPEATILELNSAGRGSGSTDLFDMADFEF